MSESYHILGIGGIGMSAVAKLLKQKNCSVKGSDITENNIIKELIKENINIQIGHENSNLDKNDILVISSAIKEDNIEFKLAKKLNLKILHRSEVLNEISKNYKNILITGTHGKTTTSSLLAHVLLHADLDPSFALGGLLLPLNTNAKLSHGNYFVMEADESDNSFNKTSAFAAIVTNLEKEHLDFWKNFENLKEGFKTFFKNVQSENILWCYDDENLKSLNPKGFSYGVSNDADFKISNLRFENFKTFFDIKYLDKEYKDIKLNLSGKHNILNAASVFALSILLNIEEKYVREAFETFLGVSRRLEKIFDNNNLQVFDDYAHHPSEIKATLNALRQSVNEKKIIAFFQPHRYSRFSDLYNDFLNAFEDADELYVLDIYSAGEKKIKKLNSKKFVKDILKNDIKAKFLKSFDHFPINKLKPFDVMVSLGAGNISRNIREFSKKLETFQKKLNVGIFYGGKSNESEISVRSAKNFTKFFDEQIYNLSFFKITKDGSFIFENKTLSDSKNKSKKIITNKILKEILKLDLVFPIMHGPFGEEGSIFSFIETLNIAVIGPNNIGAAVSMDKAITKYVAIANNIKTAKFYDLFKQDYFFEKEKNLDKILENLKFPFYVKPSHLGSSIGIKKACDINSLKEAIEFAFKFDNRILIEEEVKGREVNVSIIGNDFIYFGNPGEIVSNGQFFDYKNKYEKTTFTIKLHLIEDSVIKELVNSAKKIYKKCYLSSFSRIDFFITDNNEVFLNEINPIPGFSSENSLFFKMLISKGFEAKELINKFVVLAFHQKKEKEKFNKEKMD